MTSCSEVIVVLKVVINFYYFAIISPFWKEFGLSFEEK